MSGTQLPLALSPPRRAGFDNFIAGPNASVVATLASGMETGQWFFLAGPSGSGRSHLAQAAFYRLCSAGITARFLPVAGLDAGRSAALLAESGCDWMIVDDVDSLAGDPDAERAVFNALNRWRAARTGVLMTGRGRRDFRLPDLRSRLGQCVCLTLHPLTDADFEPLVRQLARDLEVPLGKAVVEYLIPRMPRNPGQVAGLMHRLAERAQTERRLISVPLARRVLSDAG